MDTIRLGRTGLEVSRLCLGMMSFGDPTWRPWVLPGDDAAPIVRRALELGINFFDTADMYSRGASEEALGRALRDLVPRDEVVVATKVFWPLRSGPNQGGLSRKHVYDAATASLRRLGLDYIDLYQIHRWDRHTPIEETLEALDDLVRAGHVRYVGASSMYAWQFAKALFTSDAHGWSRFVSMQNHYNLLYREEEREMNPLCLDQGVGLLPWSPLARGFLTGNRLRGGEAPTARAESDSYAHSMYYSDQDFDVVERLVEVSARLGQSPAQIAMAWLLHQPGVAAPIVGVTKMAHLEEAAGAVDIVLAPEDLAALAEPYRPRAILGHS